MSSNQPALTVVIPAFQAERFILESVGSALAQEGVDVDVVVVDDGSTDRTADVLLSLNDPRIRVLRQENKGQAAARNRGCGAAPTEFVAFLDADDRLEPRWAAAVVGELERGAAVAVADAFIFNDSGARDPATYYESLAFPVLDQQGAILQRNFVLSTAAARRSAVVDVGGFREDQWVRGVEDWALWQDIVLAGGRVALVRKVLSGYRRGHVSTSSNIEGMKRAEVRLMRLRLKEVRRRPVLRAAASSGLRRIRGDLMLHRVRVLQGTAPRRAAICAARAAWYLRRRSHVKTAILLALSPKAGRAHATKMIGAGC